MIRRVRPIQKEWKEWKSFFFKYRVILTLSNQHSTCAYQIFCVIVLDWYQSVLHSSLNCTSLKIWGSLLVSKLFRNVIIEKPEEIRKVVIIKYERLIAMSNYIWSNTENTSTTKVFLSELPQTIIEIKWQLIMRTSSETCSSVKDSM